MRLVTTKMLNYFWKKGIKDTKATPDDSLSTTSINSVQNRVVTAALENKVEGKGIKLSVVDGILTVTY